MNWLIVGISIVGVMMSVAAHFCSYEHMKHHPEARLFGRLNWGLVGIIGYIIVGATSDFPVVTMALAVTALLVTIKLIKVACAIQLQCCFCVIVWAVNGFFFFAALYNLVQPWTWFGLA